VHCLKKHIVDTLIAYRGRRNSTKQVWSPRNLETD